MKKRLPFPSSCKRTAVSVTLVLGWANVPDSRMAHHPNVLRGRRVLIYAHALIGARRDCRFVFTMTTKLLSALGGLLLSLGVCRADPSTRHAPFWAGKLWAEYSPYAPAGSYKPPPQGCSIKQVNLVNNNDSRSCPLL